MNSASARSTTVNPLIPIATATEEMGIASE